MQEDPQFFGFHHGYEVFVDNDIGHLWVIHDGAITWDQLQDIKNEVWGQDARAIECYPAQSNVVNSIECRHLWRLGPMDFAPDLLGDDGHADSITARFAVGWSGARV